MIYNNLSDNGLFFPKEAPNSIVLLANPCSDFIAIYPPLINSSNYGKKKFY